MNELIEKWELYRVSLDLQNEVIINLLVKYNSEPKDNTNELLINNGMKLKKPTFEGFMDFLTT